MTKKDDLVEAARQYLAAEDAYSSWVNDPDSHMSSSRGPGAGYYHEAQEKAQRTAARFASAAGLDAKDLGWRALHPIAYKIVAAAPPTAEETYTPARAGGSGRHTLFGAPQFVSLEGHPTCYPGWSCPDAGHDRWPKAKRGSTG